MHYKLKKLIHIQRSIAMTDSSLLIILNISNDLSAESSIKSFFNFVESKELKITRLAEKHNSTH